MLRAISGTIRRRRTNLGQLCIQWHIHQRDIATLAGCCQGTVSESFREHGLVCAETREKVRRAARQLLRRKGVG